MTTRHLTTTLVLLMLTPLALGAPGDLDQTDPAGDEAVRIPLPVPEGTCDAPAADILSYSLRFSQQQLVASLTVRDLAGHLVCGDTDFGAAGSFNARVSLWAPWTSDVVNVDLSVSGPDPEALYRNCWRVTIPNGSGADHCYRVPASSTFSGNTWTFSTPLTGQAEDRYGNFIPYDLRDRTFEARANVDTSYGVQNFRPQYANDMTAAATYST